MDASQANQFESQWHEFSGDQFHRLYNLAEAISACLNGLDGFGQLTLEEFVDLAMMEAARRSGVWPQPVVDADED